jgi:hypothetical protein
MWNGHSPEVQTVDFLSRLALEVATRSADPYIIETGVGHGFITRHVIDAIPETARLVSFESHHKLREQIKRQDFWTDHLNACIRNEIFPDEADFRTANLVMLDSAHPWKTIEVLMWRELAPEGSVLWASGQPPFGDARWLNSPRPGFLAEQGKPEPSDRYQALWEYTLEEVRTFG